MAAVKMFEGPGGAVRIASVGSSKFYQRKKYVVEKLRGRQWVRVGALGPFFWCFAVELARFHAGLEIGSLGKMIAATLRGKVVSNEVVHSAWHRRFGCRWDHSHLLSKDRWPDTLPGYVCPFEWYQTVGMLERRGVLQAEKSLG